MDLYRPSLADRSPMIPSVLKIYTKQVKVHFFPQVNPAVINSSPHVCREVSRDRDRDKKRDQDDDEESYERRKLERKLRDKETAYQEVREGGMVRGGGHSS